MPFGPRSAVRRLGTVHTAYIAGDDTGSAAQLNRELAAGEADEFAMLSTDLAAVRAGRGLAVNEPDERSMSGAEELMWHIERDPWMAPSGGRSRSSTDRSMSPADAGSSPMPWQDPAG